MSRGSLTEVRERLAGVLASQAADPQQLARDLFGVTALLDDQAAVRRFLSDPARDASARRGLASQLLGGRVSAPAMDVITALVTASWSEPADMASACEQAAVLAVAEAADRAGVADDVEDELFRFGRVVNAEPQLRIILSDPFIAAERKSTLLRSLLEGRVTAPAMTLITQAADRPRGRSLDVSLDEYARLAAERRRRLVAEVHTAVELTAAQRDRLRHALAGAYGQDVHLNVVTDPAIIGGLSVQVGDEIIDGTVAGRMAELRRKMAA